MMETEVLLKKCYILDIRFRVDAGRGRANLGVE